MADSLVVLKEYAPARFLERGADGKLFLRSESCRSEFNRSLERFLSAAEELDGFSHPNVTGLIDLFEANNTAYVVMSYAEGEDLLSLLARGSALNQVELRRIFVPVLDGVEKLHQRGLVHPRIRSEHVVVTKDRGGVLIGLFSIRGAAQHTPSAERCRSELRSPAAWIDIWDLNRLFEAAVAGSSPGVTRDRLPQRTSELHDEPVATQGKRRYVKDFLEAVKHTLGPTPQAPRLTLRAWRRGLGFEQPSTSPSVVLASGQAGSPGLDNLAGEPRRTTIEEPLALSAKLSKERCTNAAEPVAGSSFSTVPNDEPPVPQRTVPPASRRHRSMPGMRLVHSAVLTAAGVGLIGYFGGWGILHSGLMRSTDNSGIQRAELSAAETIGKPVAISAQRTPIRIGYRETKNMPPVVRGAGATEGLKPKAQSKQVPLDLAAVGRRQVSGAAGSPIEPKARHQTPEPPKPDTPEGYVRAPPTPLGSPAPTFALRRAARIEALLRQAAADLAALRLTRPEGRSALEKYRQILALESNNVHAVRGVKAIVDHYVELAHANIRSDRPSLADRYLDRAASIEPDARAIQRARRAAAAKRKTILAAHAPGVRLNRQEAYIVGDSAVPRNDVAIARRRSSPFEEFLMRVETR